MVWRTINEDNPDLQERSHEYANHANAIVPHETNTSTSGKAYVTKLSVTLEAQEAQLTAQYEKVLRHQRNLMHPDKDEWKEVKGDYERLLCEIQLSHGGSSVIAQLEYLCLKNIAHLCLKHEEYLGPAFDYFLQAIQMDETDALVWYAFGRTAMKLSRYRQARVAMECSLRLRSDHWPALHKLVQVLFILKDDIRCQDAAHALLTHDPKNILALQMRQCLESPDPQGKQFPNNLVLQTLIQLRNQSPKQPFVAPPGSTSSYPVNKLTWVELGRTVVDIARMLLDSNEPSEHQRFTLSIPDGIFEMNEVVSSSEAKEKESGMDNKRKRTEETIVEEKTMSPSKDIDKELDMLDRQTIDVNPNKKPKTDIVDLSTESPVKETTTTTTTPAATNAVQGPRRTSKRTQERLQMEHAAAVAEARDRDIQYQLQKFTNFIPGLVPSSFEWNVPTHLLVHLEEEEEDAATEKEQHRRLDIHEAQNVRVCITDLNQRGILGGCHGAMVLINQYLTHVCQYWKYYLGGDAFTTLVLDMERLFRDRSVSSSALVLDWNCRLFLIELRLNHLRRKNEPQHMSSAEKTHSSYGHRIKHPSVDNEPNDEEDQCVHELLFLLEEREMEDGGHEAESVKIDSLRLLWCFVQIFQMKKNFKQADEKLEECLEFFTPSSTLAATTIHLGNLSTGWNRLSIMDLSHRKKVLNENQIIQSALAHRENVESSTTHHYQELFNQFQVIYFPHQDHVQLYRRMTDLLHEFSQKEVDLTQANHTFKAKRPTIAMTKKKGSCSILEIFIQSCLGAHEFQFGWQCLEAAMKIVLSDHHGPEFKSQWSHREKNQMLKFISHWSCQFILAETIRHDNSSNTSDHQWWKAIHCSTFVVENQLAFQQLILACAPLILVPVTTIKKDSSFDKDGHALFILEHLVTWCCLYRWYDTSLSLFIYVLQSCPAHVLHSKKKQHQLQIQLVVQCLTLLPNVLEKLYYSSVANFQENQPDIENQQKRQWLLRNLPVVMKALDHVDSAYPQAILNSAKAFLWCFLLTSPASTAIPESIEEEEEQKHEENNHDQKQQEQMQIVMKVDLIETLHHLLAQRQLCAISMKKKDGDTTHDELQNYRQEELDGFDFLSTSIKLVHHLKTTTNQPDLLNSVLWGCLECKYHFNLLVDSSYESEEQGNVKHKTQSCEEFQTLDQVIDFMSDISPLIEQDILPSKEMTTIVERIRPHVPLPWINAENDDDAHAFLHQVQVLPYLMLPQHSYGYLPEAFCTFSAIISSQSSSTHNSIQESLLYTLLGQYASIYQEGNVQEGMIEANAKEEQEKSCIEAIQYYICDLHYNVHRYDSWYGLGELFRELFYLFVDATIEYFHPWSATTSCHHYFISPVSSEEDNQEPDVVHDFLQCTTNLYFKKPDSDKEDHRQEERRLRLQQLLEWNFQSCVRAFEASTKRLEIMITEEEQRESLSSSRPPPMERWRDELADGYEEAGMVCFHYLQLILNVYYDKKTISQQPQPQRYEQVLSQTKSFFQHIYNLNARCPIDPFRYFRCQLMLGCISRKAALGRLKTLEQDTPILIETIHEVLRPFQAALGILSDEKDQNEYDYYYTVYRLHSIRLKFLLQYSNFEIVPALAHYCFQRDSNSNNNITGFDIYRDCIQALEWILEKNRYFHQASYRLAWVYVYAPVRWFEQLTPVTEKVIDMTVEKEEEVPTLAQCQGALAMMDKYLFDKRRSQIVSIWLKSSSAAKAHTNLMEEYHERPFKYDQHRLKLIYFYISLLVQLHHHHHHRHPHRGVDFGDDHDLPCIVHASNRKIWQWIVKTKEPTTNRQMKHTCLTIAWTARLWMLSHAVVVSSESYHSIFIDIARLWKDTQTLAREDIEDQEEENVKMIHVWLHRLMVMGYYVYLKKVLVGRYDPECWKDYQCPELPFVWPKTVGEWKREMMMQQASSSREGLQKTPEPPKDLIEEARACCESLLATEEGKKKS